LLRKSDLLSGASRTFFELLKTQLEEHKQTDFSNIEVRRWLRLPKSTVRRRFLELLDIDVMRRIATKEKKVYRYEFVDKEDYKTLKTTIEKALQDCIDKINRANGSE
jgi:predicted transcriptional regulator